MWLLIGGAAALYFLMNNSTAAPAHTIGAVRRVRFRPYSAPHLSGIPGGTGGFKTQDDYGFGTGHRSRYGYSDQ